MARFACLQNFDGFLRGLVGFAGVAVPAAVVNAGLKYMQKRLQLAFMRRLTHHLHMLYCSNRAYYAASVLGGAFISGCNALLWLVMLQVLI